MTQVEIMHNQKIENRGFVMKMELKPTNFLLDQTVSALAVGVFRTSNYEW